MKSSILAAQKIPKMAKEHKLPNSRIEGGLPKVFGCAADPDSEIVKLKKPYLLYHIDGHAVPILKYAGKGKPGPLA